MASMREQRPAQQDLLKATGNCEERLFPNPPATSTMPRMATETLSRGASRPVITRERFDAVLFDLDGVLTSTAAIHAEAWKHMFDDYLRRQPGAESAARLRPFEI